MASPLNKLLIAGLAAALLAACASSVPSNFVYDTSLRGEQGWIGASSREASAKALLDGGVVQDPNESLRAALPDAEVNLQRWGLVYFSKNWKRYKVVLDADVTRDGEKVKCRLTSPERLSDAPTLSELRADDGAEIQRRLDGLVAACARQSNALP